MLSRPLRSELLEVIALRARFVSLHHSDPGRTGAGELGVEFYRRQPVSWDASYRNGAEVAFVIAPTAFTHVGYWDSEVGGEFRLGSPTVLTHAEDVAVCRFAPRALSLLVEEIQ